MSQPRTAPYGSWKSPIQARQIAEGTVRFDETRLEGGHTYWTELRPTESGRCVIVRCHRDGTLVDMTPSGFNARTRVHEYGGGSYLTCGEKVMFVNFDDQRLYVYTGQGRPSPITACEDGRFADFECDQKRKRLIAIREKHNDKSEPANTIVAIYPEKGAEIRHLVGGNDFYAAARISPDGSQLAWLTWDHPNMPWDDSELWVAPVAEDGELGEATHVAGGSGESIVQPQWSPDGVLHFISDRTNWWNIYRWRAGHIEPLTCLEAEFGSAQWRFDCATYGFDGPSRIICSYVQDGLWHLAKLDTITTELSEIETPYKVISDVRVADGRVVFIGGAPRRPTAVVFVDLVTAKVEELRQTNELEIDPGYISVPEAIEFPTENGLRAHGFFYPPRNKDYVAPEGEKPPLVVVVHGGPTAATGTSLSLQKQFYTSRGIAVLDVNYGGSTGYGREYRERLYGQWGIVDVDDSCNGARYLAKQGLVDAERMAITGGSAGGYTTLSALTFRDVFAAGSSHYGVSDCEILAKETHKFESRYLDRLIGPYPECRDVYIERSPIHHVDGLSCPVAFFQGLEDEIVPPNQAQMMADALKRKRLPVALMEFEGEQHGFRKAENIQRALEAELYFFSRVFRFDLAEHVEPIRIENM